MTIEKCLDAKVQAGRLTREQAERALKFVRRLENDFVDDMGPEAAEAAAAAEAARIMEGDARGDARSVALQILLTKKNADRITSHPKGAANGLLALLARDRFDAATYRNVDKQINAILGGMHDLWADGMNRFRTKAAGLRQDRTGLRAFVRELYGQDTGDAAVKAAAKEWAETVDRVKDRYRAAGGRIADREDWRLPQTHDARPIGRVSFQTWRDFFAPLIDREKVLDFETGRPVNDIEFETILTQAYESITTRGMSDLVPGEPTPFRRTGGLAGRHSYRRVFVFKDADSWLAYNDRFGMGDGGIYALLTGHMHAMARDTALLEILGPDPDSMFRHLRDVARTGRAGGEVLDAVYETVTGRANDSSVRPWAANLGRQVRNTLVSSQLGKAFVTAMFSDPRFLTKTSAWNGVPATKVLRRTAQLLDPRNEADRIAAVRLDLVAEGWATHALAAARFQDEVIGIDIPARMADFVMRSTGLSPWTQAGRWAFGMEFSGFMADNVARGFDDLPPPLRRGFERYGIDADVWDVIRRAPLFEHRGVGFVRAENILKLEGVDQGVRVRAASKLSQMIQSEMDFAIPQPDALVRGIATLGNKPGTVIGEVMRSTFMYKSFGITVAMTHVMRGATQNTGWERGKYLADLAISITVMMGFGIQARQILAGKDPRDMTDAAFWFEAFALGGGLGIYGDLLTLLAKKGERGLSTDILGPVAGLLDDTGRLTIGNLAQALGGRETNVGRDVARFVRRYTPGSTIWYSQLATDRLLFDRLQMMLDPDYADSFARSEQRALDKFGQEYFFAPGELTPRRPPDLGAAIPDR